MSTYDRTQIAALIFCAAALVLANWRLHDLARNLQARKQMSGQTITIDGIKTERYVMPDGKLEPLSEWQARVQEALKAFPQ